MLNTFLSRSNTRYFQICYSVLLQEVDIPSFQILDLYMLMLTFTKTYILIIKYSSKEIYSTKEKPNKILRFYTTFIVPMLGVHSRLCSSEATEGDAAFKLGTVKNTATSITKSDGSPNADATILNLKKPKANCNGDSNTSPERVSYCKMGFTNMDTLVEEDGSTVASGGRFPNSDTTVIIEQDTNHGMCIVKHLVL